MPRGDRQLLPLPAVPPVARRLAAPRLQAAHQVRGHPQGLPHSLLPATRLQGSRFCFFSGSLIKESLMIILSSLSQSEVVFKGRLWFSVPLSITIAWNRLCFVLTNSTPHIGNPLRPNRFSID